MEPAVIGQASRVVFRERFGSMDGRMQASAPATQLKASAAMDLCTTFH